MLIRNLCPWKGHVNGATYMVEHMSSNLHHLKVAVGRTPVATSRYQEFKADQKMTAFPFQGSLFACGSRWQSIKYKDNHSEANLGLSYPTTALRMVSRMCANFESSSFFRRQLLILKSVILPKFVICAISRNDFIPSSRSIWPPCAVSRSSDPFPMWSSGPGIVPE